MKPPPEFYSSLAGRRNQELIDALARSHEYEPEAVEAFRAELLRRGIQPPALAEQVNASAAWFAPIEQKSNEPLEWPLRFMCLFVLGPLLLAVLGANFRKHGYHRKARELFEWTGYGIGFWCLLYLALRLVDHYRVYE